MRMLDLFAGRLGWSKAFLERGWEVVAYDLTFPDMDIPKGVDYRLQDILTLSPEDVKGFDFICASSPCEQFSVHGMKHFFPNPKYPEMGLALFNHTRLICEMAGVPYIMENVRSAQAFVGNASHHCGSFYLWGPGVPPLIPKGKPKGLKQGRDPITGKRDNSGLGRRSWSKSPERKKDQALAAEIPYELSNCVADYAERICAG
jgi:hypothetical protein